MTAVTRLHILTLNMSLAAVAPAGSPLPWPLPLKKKATTVAGLDPDSLDRERAPDAAVKLPAYPPKAQARPQGGALRRVA